DFGENPADLMSIVFVPATAGPASASAPSAASITIGMRIDAPPASNGLIRRMFHGFRTPTPCESSVLLTRDMPLQMADKRALIAGGTGRLGAAIAARLESEGWRVVAAGRPAGDLAGTDGARSLVTHALEELGGLDLVVQAAGEGFVPRRLADVTEADWDSA